MTLLKFVQWYKTPKRAGQDITRRKKAVVVIVRPICSPDPAGSNYEQYCRQKLMLHQPFRQVDELLGSSDNYSDAYTLYLQTGRVPPSLADDIRRLEAAGRNHQDNNVSEVSFIRLY